MKHVLLLLLVVGLVMFTCVYFLVEDVQQTEGGTRGGGGREGSREDMEDEQGKEEDATFHKEEEEQEDEEQEDEGEMGPVVDEVQPADATEDHTKHISESSIFDKYQEKVDSSDDDYIELDDGGYYNFKVDRIIAPVLNARQHAEAKQLPMVVWWTPFSGDVEGKIKRCDVGDCYFSTNRSLYEQHLPTTFMFYGTDFNVSDLPLPRKGHHAWALLHEESPKNQAVFLYEDTISVFNYTSTFRQHSNYPITTQYVISQSYLLNPRKYTYLEKQHIQLKEGLASLVYIQSGCNPPSDRDAYVHELQKYIRVDCYGECLHNRDLPPEYRDTSTMFSPGFVDILEKYKFIVAFENGICEDYVTEKLFRTLFVGAVPVYKGAPNVREWLPSNTSAIIVDDFASPKELAEYIKSVDQNRNEYEKYLEYKNTGITNPLLKTTLENREWGVDTPYQMSFVTGFECYVCDQIHKNRQQVAAGGEVVEQVATREHYGCGAPRKYDFPSPEGDEGWERDVWAWEYEQAAESVKKLKEAMELRG